MAEIEPYGIEDEIYIDEHFSILNDVENGQLLVMAMFHTNKTAGISV